MFRNRKQIEVGGRIGNWGLSRRLCPPQKKGGHENRAKQGTYGTSGKRYMPPYTALIYAYMRHDQAFFDTRYSFGICVKSCAAFLLFGALNFARLITTALRVSCASRPDSFPSAGMSAGGQIALRIFLSLRPVQRNAKWMPARVQRTEPPAFSIVGMSRATGSALSLMMVT